MHRTLIATILLILFAGQGGYTKQSAYMYVLLGSLGGHGTHITAIDGKGNAVGASETTAGTNHAFFFDIETRAMQDLGTLGGDHSLANAINDAGQIVGKAENATGDQHGFLYDSVHGMVDLHALISLGGDNSTALAINNAGVIVGGSEDEDGESHAIRYDLATGTLTDLGFMRFGDSSLAFGINDFNDIVGNGTLLGEAGSRAFIASAMGTSAPAMLVDIGSLGGTEANLQGISNARVGFGFGKTAAGSFHALAYDPKRGVVDLGTLGGPDSSANGANSHGTIVGQSDTTGEVPHGFVYDSRGMRDLNVDLPLGLVVARATAVNDDGFIAGDGWFKDLPRAFVLVPTVPPTTLSYNATGLWHHSVTLDGQVVDEADTVLTQDADGNITHCGECEGELWTFTKLGTPPGKIRYSVTLTSPDAPCQAPTTGTAELDISTNVITGTLTGPLEDCTTIVTASLLLKRY